MRLTPEVCPTLRGVEVLVSCQLTCVPVRLESAFGQSRRSYDHWFFPTLLTPPAALERVEGPRTGIERCVGGLQSASSPSCSIPARTLTCDPGLAIPVIENLASHQGSYDTLNLTDNSITVLGNIPLGGHYTGALALRACSIVTCLLTALAPRLQAIHIASNQITSISPSLPPNVSGPGYIFSRLLGR
jgi:U2 small nuclear ribonucleoprotein A'